MERLTDVIVEVEAGDEGGGEAAADPLVVDLHRATPTEDDNIGPNLRPNRSRITVLGPKLFFVTGLVIFVTAVARLVCPDLLG